MTESDDTKYPIGRGEVIPHPAIQQSIELCTGRYENAKLHIQAGDHEIGNQARFSFDLGQVSTLQASVHYPQFVPYPPGVL